jgi:3-dehydroquinate synthase
MQTLQVDLAERSYPIYIGSNLLIRSELLVSHIAGRQVAIVTNETVAPLYLQQLLQVLNGFAVTPVILADGCST